MIHKDDDISVIFFIHDPSTGELIEADSLPTAELYIGGVLSTETVTITNNGGGEYSAEVSIGASLSGLTVEIIVSATVDSTDASAVVFSSMLQSKSQYQADISAIQTATLTGGVEINLETMQGIADELLKRAVVNVEGIADTYSIAALILSRFSSSISGDTWTIKQTDGNTVFTTRTVYSNEAGAPVTRVSQ